MPAKHALQPRYSGRSSSVPAEAKYVWLNNGGRAARAPKKMITVSARRVATRQSILQSLVMPAALSGLQGGLLRYARKDSVLSLRGA